MVYNILVHFHVITDTKIFLETQIEFTLKHKINSPPWYALLNVCEEMRSAIERAPITFTQMNINAFDVVSSLWQFANCDAAYIQAYRLN